MESRVFLMSVSNWSSLNVISHRCILFLGYTKNTVLTQHMYKFSRLPVSALLTSRHQTFFNHNRLIKKGLMTAC
jgi:hypothetical protein